MDAGRTNKKRKSIRLPWLALLACWPLFVFGGEMPDDAAAPIFYRLPLDNALSQNTVTDMLQDRRGLLWFGTLGGLDVYDGYTFRALSSDPRRADALSGVNISRLYEDRQGNIWVAGLRGWLDRIAPDSEQIHHYDAQMYGDEDHPRPGPTAFYETDDGTFFVGTVTGLHRYDPVQDRFERNVVPADELSGIWDFESADDGRLWVGAVAGLYLLDPSTLEWRLIEHDPADADSLPQGTIVRLLEDDQGRLWVGSAMHGLARMLDDGRFLRFESDMDDPMSIGSNTIMDLIQDDTGTIWVANQSGGLSRFLSDEEGFIVYRTDLDDPHSLANNDVWSLFEDRTGLIWIGTAGSGLAQINSSRNRFDTLHSIPYNDNSLRYPFVWDIAESADGRIWMTTLAGLEVYNPDTGRYSHYTPEPGAVAANQLQSVVVDSTGRVWVGAIDGSLYLVDTETGSFTEIFRSEDHSEHFDAGRIWTMEADGDLLWIAGNNGLYAVDIETFDVVDELRPTDSMPMGGNPIRVIRPVGDGSLWLGGGGAGLSRYQPGVGVVENYRRSRSNPESLSHNVVRALHIDAAGDLWIGTLNGLNKLAREDREAGRNRFTLFTSSDGLPNNTVYGIVPAEDGVLWLTTNQGISRFDVNARQFENFDVADGLPANEMNGGAELKSSDGRIYIGGVGGVTVIRPGAIAHNDETPFVEITGFSVRGERLPLSRLDDPEGIGVKFGDNDIDIEYAVMDYHQPEKNRFEYRLLGAFSEWRETADRRIGFTGLPPGDYVFELRGANNDGVWSSGVTSATFRIAPPPWRTPLAYAVYLGLLILVVLAYHQSQRRRLSRERNFNEQLTRAHSLAEANHQMALRYAQSDMLTQLPNRASLMDALARYMRFSRSEASSLAVLLINLDRFQELNDSFGHPIGDRVLKSIAQQLDAIVGENDFLARVGADEFAWVLTLDGDTDVDTWTEYVLRNISAAVGRPFDFQDPPVVLSASVGCAFYVSGTETASQFLGRADVALHVAKSEGGRRLRCYDPAMTESARQRISIETRLKRALETGELSAHFQPLVGVKSKSLKAFEALIRWTTKDGEQIFPDQFIPVAEQSGLIVDVGNWMIRNVCKQLSEWQKLEPTDYQVAINVSMRQLRSGTLVPTLRAALAETGISPGMLKVEITESAMMENVEDTAEQLLEVRRLGVDISVDDFGTGFSSLGHLKMLPVDELKIDRSFIMDVATSEESRTIVMSIVRLAHELNLRVVAEGVEDETALEFLASIGCDIAQGYYFSRPLPPEQVLENGWLRLPGSRAASAN